MADEGEGKFEHWLERFGLGGEAVMTPKRRKVGSLSILGGTGLLVACYFDPSEYWGAQVWGAISLFELAFIALNARKPNQVREVGDNRETNTFNMVIALIVTLSVASYNTYGAGNRMYSHYVGSGDAAAQTNGTPDAATVGDNGKHCIKTVRHNKEWSANNAQLQTALKAEGDYPYIVDGIWQGKTDKAVEAANFKHTGQQKTLTLNDELCAALGISAPVPVPSEPPTS